MLIALDAGDDQRKTRLRESLQQVLGIGIALCGGNSSEQNLGIGLEKREARGLERLEVDVEAGDVFERQPQPEIADSF